jgi:hypothetical protein
MAPFFSVFYSLKISTCEVYGPRTPFLPERVDWMNEFDWSQGPDRRRSAPSNRFFDCLQDCHLRECTKTKILRYSEMHVPTSHGVRSLSASRDQH